MDFIAEHQDQLITLAGIIVAFVLGKVRGGRYKRFLLKFIRGVEAHDVAKMKSDVKTIMLALGLEHIFHSLVKRNTRYTPKPEESKDAEPKPK